MSKYCIKTVLAIATISYLLLFSCKNDEEDDVSVATVTDIDGNTYKTITIGSQIWMAENLRTTKYNDGSAIQLIRNESEWNNLKIPGYCWYDNDSARYSNIYGALYNWYAVNTGKLCPSGWHIPSDEEWTTLTEFLGGASIAGGKLKETNTTYWNTPNNGSTDEFGFAALPGGGRNLIGSFTHIGIYGFWWSSTTHVPNYSFYRRLNFDNSNIEKSNTRIESGFSVRCIKD
jgi:uncharacterized protein (TIGR02145 family)